ncbi:histidine kinase [Halomarina halobia]|uniref:Histidine kinase n=1 Tax=Halomarina halobia TaxID=3033386 RepID=A0ABD6A6Q2_9EURY|nr:histidine kinase [Halomarina sp. PSR21]
MALLNEAELSRRTDEEAARPAWMSGVVGGLAGGVVMGLMATMMMPAVMTEYIPGLLALDGLLAGWIVHLGVAATFGVGYAALATETGFVDRSPSVGWDVGLGLAYGALLWLVSMSIVMPLWLGAIGAADPPPFPWFDPATLLAHLAYGLVVGVVFPLVEFE